MRKVLEDIYRRLERHYGPTHWWPGDSPFEIAVGAVLTQNTAWVNVERAIENLKRAKLLSCKKILEADGEVLHDALHPSGFFRIKAKRLRSFCAYLQTNYRASMRRMAREPLEKLRPELLAVNGIGPETADDILLYACKKPVFVVDAYTRRILSRHGLCKPAEQYEDLRALFEDNLPTDGQVFREYHGLIVFLGKDFCNSKPHCGGCPLEPLLKPGQPLTPPPRKPRKSRK